MCGIMGIIGHRPTRDWNAWGKLTDHRGPDAFKIHEEQDFLLGHNRLSIIDLSESANQPFVSSDGKYQMVFNGEIYNYLELKLKLINKNYSFRTESDTEVLLNGFIEYGPMVLDLLDGMFSFAVWNRETKDLFMARDHAGMKPLFYSFNAGSLVFGSEIKLILDSGIVSKEIDETSIIDYLAYSYIPSPKTAYKNIFCLNPAEYIIFNLNNKSIKKTIWWNIQKNDSKKLSYSDASEQLKDIMSNSVKNRMISDVPLGAFLSGGLDSSVIVAEMVKHSSQQVNTYSIGYKDNSEYDETKYALEVSKNLGTNHEVIYPDFLNLNINDSLDSIVNQFDQPFGNPTVLLTSILTENVKEKVTVSLVGDGGDELFAGYPRHWALLQQEKYGPFLKFFSKPMLTFLSFLKETPNQNHIIRRVKRFFNSYDSNLGKVFEDSTRVFLSGDIKKLVNNNLHNYESSLNLINSLFNEFNSDTINNACYADQRSFLPFNLLEGADRMSMRNSFELRLPFLDKELMTFAANLPLEYKIKGSNQKRILKDTYSGLLPKKILMRKKRGFNPPVWHWLNNNFDEVKSSLNESNNLYKYLSKKQVQAELNSFKNNEKDNSLQLWLILVLDKWLSRQ